MKLSPGKTMLALHIEGPHNAAELDALIRRLTIERSKMEPPLPRALNTQIAGKTPPLNQADAPLNIAALANGTFQLWAFNSGLGWLGFGMSQDVAVSFRDLLIKHLGNSNPGPLLGHQEPQVH